LQTNPAGPYKTLLANDARLAKACCLPQNQPCASEVDYQRDKIGERERDRAGRNFWVELESVEN
jgi:hypothetical protein